MYSIEYKHHSNDNWVMLEAYRYLSYAMEAFDEMAENFKKRGNEILGKTKTDFMVRNPTGNILKFRISK